MTPSGDVRVVMPPWFHNRRMFPDQVNLCRDRGDNAVEISRIDRGLSLYLWSRIDVDDTSSLNLAFQDSHAEVS